MASDEKVDEILEIVRREHGLNNSRFTQLASSMIELTGKVVKLDDKVEKVEKNLKQEIDKVYNSLSEDIQAFATDLEKVRHRVDKLEKEIA